MSYISDFNIAVVCSSNMNRSMEAHAFLAKKRFKVRSFGTGDKVKLPGTALDKPNIYEFMCPYDDIYNDLMSKDKQLYPFLKKINNKKLILPKTKNIFLNLFLKNSYTQNGLLHMLDRNRRIKRCPERFQVCTEKFDIIVTVEERVYDHVIEFMESKEPVHNCPVHVINIDVQDNQEEATIGAFLICDMISMVMKIQINFNKKEFNYFFKQGNNCLGFIFCQAFNFMLFLFKIICFRCFYQARWTCNSKKEFSGAPGLTEKLSGSKGSIKVVLVHLAVRIKDWDTLVLSRLKAILSAHIN